MTRDSLKQKIRRLTLRSQGLTKSQPFGSGKNAVLRTLEHLSYAQIDTLSVVQRAHHHVLWTRVPTYQTKHLDRLVEERQVFEYWSHAAAYLPMRDFRFALPRMRWIKQGQSKYFNRADPNMLNYVRDRIQDEGPLKARDFHSPNYRAGKWWNWKPAKIALEKLFMQGDLMIARREGMQKVYDLTERVLPANISTTLPSSQELATHLIEANLRAFGLVTVSQIIHLRPNKILRQNVTKQLVELVDQKKLKRIDIPNLPTLYATKDALDETIKKPTATVKILSPFDNSIIHRDRLNQLFNFDYRLECYVPKAKRQFGYFCLPILFRDTFIGRMDCKVHRQQSKLEIIQLHIEDKLSDFDQWSIPFIKSLWQFARFNDCHLIVLGQVYPARLGTSIQRALSLYEHGSGVNS